MKVSRSGAGKVALVSMLSGQVVMVAGLLVWIQARNGSAWASRHLVMALAGGGAVLYFAGRILQMLSRRRQDRRNP